MWRRGVDGGSNVVGDDSNRDAGDSGGDRDNRDVGCGVDVGGRSVGGIEGFYEGAHVVNECLSRASDQENSDGEPPHGLVLQEVSSCGIYPLFLLLLGVINPSKPPLSSIIGQQPLPLSYLALILLIFGRENLQTQSSHNTHPKKKHCKGRKCGAYHQHPILAHEHSRHKLTQPQTTQSNTRNRQAQRKAWTAREVLGTCSEASEIHAASTHADESEGDDHNLVWELMRVGKGSEEVAEPEEGTGDE